MAPPGPSTLPALHTALRSTYRALLRELRLLPDPTASAYCRERWRGVAHKAHTGDAERGAAYLSDLRRELRRIERVNAGDVKAYERLLGLTYGRTGKRRRELVQTYLDAYPPPLHPTRAERRTPPPPLPARLTSLLAAQSISLNPTSQRIGLAPPKEAPTVNRAWRELWKGVRKVAVPLVPRGSRAAAAATGGGRGGTQGADGRPEGKVDGAALQRAIRDTLERGQEERARCAVPRRVRRAMEERGAVPPALTDEPSPPSRERPRLPSGRTSQLTPRHMHRAYRRLHAEIAKV